MKWRNPLGLQHELVRRKPAGKIWPKAVRAYLCDEASEAMQEHMF